MHQQHRDVELSLQRTKVRQQRGHLAGVVLVDAVQSHKRIQDQQPGPEPPSCLQEPSPIRVAVEPQHTRGNHMNFYVREI